MALGTRSALYRRALELVFCQPNVTGMLLFHSHDETALSAWQSGLYYADGTPKTSLSPVREALAATRGGSIARCPGLTIPIRPTISFDPKRLAIRFRRGRERCETVAAGQHPRVRGQRNASSRPCGVG